MNAFSLNRNIQSVSIVIPAYNEENAIAQTVSELKDVLTKTTEISEFEILVIDDGSDDDTAEKAEKHGAKVFKHLENLGYGRSLKDGIAMAENDTVIITDADGTYPLNKIPELLIQYKRGYQMVVGERQGKHFSQSMFKRVLRLILKFLVEFTTGKKIPDINSGLRVFSKKEIMQFYNHLCDTFSFTTSATLAYFMTGKTIAYVPIAYHLRVGKTKVHIIKDSLRTLQFIINAILYYNPIKIFLIFVAILLIISMAGFLFSLITKLNIGYILGIICILCSVITFSIGLIAEQLRQLMLKNL